ncbi:MAG TPA: Imm10 family immunity protein [Burkholderiaceae bacterium]
MDYDLEARHVHIEDDGEILTMGFSDDQFAPRKYVLLQKALKPDEQERKLGLDKIHIEVQDQGRSGYGGVSSIRYSPSRLLIELSEAARKCLDISGNIRIVLPNDTGAVGDMPVALFRASNGEFALDLQA